jgi:ubiquinol-cytochrome c reductase cytochrome c subunit
MKTVIPSAARNLLFAAALVASPAALAAGSAEKGKTAFVRHGCWQCHGFLGQGGIAGKKLAPNPMSLEAMSVFVRNTRGAMPPYQKAILSDADLADIHAYLSSLPKAPDYKSIPLLNP